MLPDFYKDYHNARVTEVLENQTERFFLFIKSVIAKHLKGRYATALLCLRLTHDEEGALFMQGYMKINTDEKHNWHNYLFVKHATKEIIEWWMRRFRRLKEINLMHNIFWRLWERLPQEDSKVHKWHKQILLRASDLILFGWGSSDNVCWAWSLRWE